MPSLDKIKEIEARAEKNDPKALRELSDLYERGDGVEKDLVKAWECLNKSIFIVYGNQKIHGPRYLSKEDGKSINRIRKAFFAQPLESKEDKNKYKIFGEQCYRIGMMYLEGTFVERDLSSAAKYLAFAVGTKNPDSLKIINAVSNSNIVSLRDTPIWKGDFSIIFDGQAETNEEKSKNIIELYKDKEAVLSSEQLQDQSNIQKLKELAEIQFKIGRCYAEEFGTSIECYRQNEAVEYFNKSAKNGNLDAKLFLASCYKDGFGVNQDAAKAAELFREVADAGYVFVQNFMGHFYEKGNGVKQNLSEAVEWYKKAADGGNIYAKNKLEEAKIPVTNLCEATHDQSAAAASVA